MPKTRKTIDLSPEARAALHLPLRTDKRDQYTGYIYDATGFFVAEVELQSGTALSAELAAFIAALVNEALTPAAPAVAIEPKSNAELGQLITTELETEQRWTAEEIWQREG